MVAQGKRRPAIGMALHAVDKTVAIAVNAAGHRDRGDFDRVRVCPAIVALLLAGKERAEVQDIRVLLRKRLTVLGCIVSHNVSLLTWSLCFARA